MNYLNKQSEFTVIREETIQRVLQKTFHKPLDVFTNAYEATSSSIHKEKWKEKQKI